MTTFNYNKPEISFDYPDEGVIFEFDESDGMNVVRFQTKRDNKTAVRIQIRRFTRSKEAKEAASNLFADRLKALRDAVDLAPYALENTKEKGWRLRKWMVDGGRILGIIDCAFLQRGEKIFKVSYFAPVRKFYSGQMAFNVIVSTFEIK